MRAAVWSRLQTFAGTLAPLDGVKMVGFKDGATWMVNFLDWMIQGYHQCRIPSYGEGKHQLLKYPKLIKNGNVMGYYRNIIYLDLPGFEHQTPSEIASAKASTNGRFF